MSNNSTSIVVDPETELTRHAYAHPIVKQLPPTLAESRFVLRMDPVDAPFNLTITTLAGPNKISVPPYVFIDNTRGTLIAFYHLGSQLSGHAGILHGGVAAALLDECMGRACFPFLPHQIGVTANLEISFRAPIMLESIVVIRAETERWEGRKVWVKGWIESPDSTTVFVEAKAVFIEPRGAEKMSKVM
ncbi:MAG: hypothetical protein M1834_008448 [Cirrosporium novae-zelandiae]|nr:MAG: hypothetical protein M1834_008448 [Cirrosporium novae-zelandiae]